MARRDELIEALDVREKMVELLKEAPYNIFDNKLGGILFDSCLGMIADHLINNGVTVQEWFSVRNPPDADSTCPGGDQAWQT